jgi:hypothetical protein
MYMDHLLIALNVVKDPLVSWCNDFWQRYLGRLLGDILSLFNSLLFAPFSFKYVLHRVIVDIGVFDHNLHILMLEFFFHVRYNFMHFLFHLLSLMFELFFNHLKYFTIHHLAHCALFLCDVI